MMTTHYDLWNQLKTRDPGQPNPGNPIQGTGRLVPGKVSSFIFIFLSAVVAELLLQPNELLSQQLFRSDALGRENGGQPARVLL
jgi:hypothetical protein